MQIQVSEQAVRWFKEEVGLTKGNTVKFQAKYGGYSPIHQGFSLAFQVNEPVRDAITSTEQGGITFFIDTTDAWYFENHDLYVDYDETLEEVAYHYKEIS